MAIPDSKIYVELRGTSGYDFNGQKGASLFVETVNDGNQEHVLGPNVCSVLPCTFDLLDKMKAQQMVIPAVYEVTLTMRRGNAQAGGKMQLTAVDLKFYDPNPKIPNFANRVDSKLDLPKSDIKA